MLKISIPTPCHEDWDKMYPNEQGRHCNSCMKTVVDFTNMTDEEVKHFLIGKHDQHLCGRFTGRQLQRIQVEIPANIFQLKMPWWKQFLVACLITFSTTLFSCEIKHSDPIKLKAASQGEVLSISGKAFDDRYNHRGYVGMFNIHTDLLQDTTWPVPVQSEDIITVPDIIMGLSVPEFENIDSIVPQNPVDSTFKGEMKFVPDSLQKNKDDADSLKCGDFS